MQEGQISGKRIFCEHCNDFVSKATYYRHLKLAKSNQLQLRSELRRDHNSHEETDTDSSDTIDDIHGCMTVEDNTCVANLSMESVMEG